jgi:hypothetical protein
MEPTGNDRVLTNINEGPKDIEEGIVDLDDLGVEHVESPKPDTTQPDKFSGLNVFVELPTILEEVSRTQLRRALRLISQITVGSWSHLSRDEEASK